MTRSAKSLGPKPRLQKLWAELLSRDDRHDLKELLEDATNASNSFDSLYPYMASIVTAAKLASHSPGSLTLSKDLVQSESQKFLSHLRDSKTLQNIHKRWLEQSSGPWSLPLELSLEYLRFKARPSVHASHKKPELNSKKKSFANVSSLLLESVDDAMKHLQDADARLVLSLHFEGLINTEISTITGVPASTVQSLIRMAKAQIKEDLKEKWAS